MDFSFIHHFKFTISFSYKTECLLGQNIPMLSFLSASINIRNSQQPRRPTLKKEQTRTLELLTTQIQPYTDSLIRQPSWHIWNKKFYNLKAPPAKISSISALLVPHTKRWRFSLSRMRSCSSLNASIFASISFSLSGPQLISPDVMWWEVTPSMQELDFYRLWGLPMLAHNESASDSKIDS